MKHFLTIVLLFFNFSTLGMILGQTAPQKAIKHYYPDGTTEESLFSSKGEKKNLLVVHGFSHCPWFKISIHHLRKIQKENPDTYIKLLVADNNQAEIDDFISQYHGKIPFTIITSLLNDGDSISVAMNASASASVFIFNEKDKLIERYEGAPLPKTHSYLGKILSK